MSSDKKSAVKSSEPKRTLKGTFGHMNSRIDSKLISLNRTISAESSDLRRYIVATEIDEDGEFNSEDKLKDSGVDDAEVNSSSVDDSVNLRRTPADRKCAAAATTEVYHDEDELSGVLDDLPSGIVDVDGTLIAGKLHVRFGQEDSDNEEDEVPSEPIQVKNVPPQSPTDLKSPILPSSPSTTSSSRTILSKFLSRKKPSDTSVLISHNFRNPYSHDHDMILRKHVGGSPSVRNKVQVNNSDRKDSTGATITSSSTTNSTITQHYYPEGGWGYVILFTAFLTHTLLCGLLLSSGILIVHVTQLFRYENSRNKVGIQDAVWLAGLSNGISLLLSPIWIAICKRKSTRLVAVFGGLLISLGCLFTSFASQFHQLFVSYGLFIGIGFGLTRDASSLMVGQYFKRKRELVETVLVSASGFGILFMSEAIHLSISSLGWRLGLQSITGFIFLTFFLGTCYRSASLYHPQRRAILHLKNQKRKVKDKEKREDKPPFLDFGCLRSKTLQILLISSAFISFGIYTPLFHLGFHYIEQSNADRDKIPQLQTNDTNIVILYTIIGGLWVTGSVLFALIVLQKNQECRVSKQYLCQMASTICGISILALTAAVEGFNGLVIFACVYGFSLGAYNYILKVYTYERVRARHFPRAWSFIQSAQAIPLIVGAPLSGYLNSNLEKNSGYYLAAASVLFGSAFLFVTDFHKKTLARRKTLNSSIKTRSETQESAQSPSSRRISFAFPGDCSPEPKSNSSHHSRHSHSHSHHSEGHDDPEVVDKELTSISEEGIADMDFQDVNYEEWNEYLGDCITSCNKVELEDCLISEFDPEHPMLQGKRVQLGRKGQIKTGGIKPNLSQSGIIGSAAVAIAGGIAGLNISRSISTIEEAEDSSQDVFQ